MLDFKSVYLKKTRSMIHANMPPPVRSYFIKDQSNSHYNVTFTDVSTKAPEKANTLPAASELFQAQHTFMSSYCVMARVMPRYLGAAQREPSLKWAPHCNPAFTDE